MTLDEAHDRLAAAYETYRHRHKKPVTLADTEQYVGEHLDTIAQRVPWDKEVAKQYVERLEASLRG